MSNCCNSCPCAKANAVVQKAYVLTVKANQASAVLGALSKAEEILGIISIGVEAINTLGTLAILGSTTAGSLVITVVTDVEDRTNERKLLAMQTIMELAAAYDSCLQEISGVVLESELGTNMQAISAVVTQANSAQIQINAIQTLFCRPVPVPVAVFFATSAASAAAEVLSTIINTGIYLCTGDPLNPNA